MISDASDSSPSAEAAARWVSGHCLSTAARTAGMIGKEASLHNGEDFSQENEEDDNGTFDA
jgi:hypothetical protein